MCGGIQRSGKKCRIGSMVAFSRQDGSMASGKWQGHARKETIDDPSNSYWSARRYERVLVPVDQFSERDRRTGKLVWSGQPTTIWALKAKSPQRRDLVVVTREATPEEKEKFGHDRVPLTTNEVPAPASWAQPAHQPRLLEV